MSVSMDTQCMTGAQSPMGAIASVAQAIITLISRPSRKCLGVVSGVMPGRLQESLGLACFLPTTDKHSGIPSRRR
jgi:hypothetical protein